MAAKGSRIAVGTNPTRISTQPTDRVGGSALLVRNAHASASVDLGGEDVATGEGFELAASESTAVDLDARESLYAVAASGTVTVHVLEVGI